MRYINLPLTLALTSRPMLDLTCNTSCSRRMLTVHSYNATVTLTHTHTNTHPFNGLCPGLPGWAGTRKVKPIWILLKQETVRQICTSLQTDNHAGTPPLSFLQAGCPSCRPTNSVKAMKATVRNSNGVYIIQSGQTSHGQYQYLHLSIRHAAASPGFVTRPLIAI